MILSDRTFIKRYSKVGLFSLIAIDTIFALIYFISALITSKALGVFNCDHQWSIPVIYSAIQLLVMGLFLVIAAFRRKCSAPLTYS